MSKSHDTTAGIQSGPKLLLAVVGFILGTFALLWVLYAFLFS
jgi:hypothetical protein